MNKDWFEQLEQRRTAVLTALILITIATLAVGSMRNPMGYDSFWHLRMGQDWVEQGLSPFVDHYSFTRQGEAITTPPYLFEALYYLTVDWLGVNSAYKLLYFVALLLTTAMLLLWLRVVRAPLVIILLAVPVLTVLLFLRGHLRPEVFSWPLMILSLVVCEKARIQPGFKYFLAIAAIMLLWTNYHSAVLGYVIFFGLFVDLAVAQFRDRAPAGRWMAWAGWGGLIVAVGFANPGFSHPVIASLRFSGEWLSLILEYSSPWQEHAPLAACLLVLAAVTVVLLLRQRLFGYAVVCLVFAWHASQLARMLGPSGIVVLCLFSLACSRIDLHAAMTGGSQARRSLIAAIWAVLFVVPLLTGVSEARTRVKSNPSLLGYFPDRLVQYMKDSGKKGRVFNDYAIGGYLIYHLAPEIQVYIDGRTGILYPLETHKRWQKASTDPQALMDEIAEYDIDYVILSNRPEHVDLVGQIPSMHLDFADLRYSLYARDNAKFPLAGALWSNPSCWPQGLESGIRSEQVTAMLITPEYSLLIPILQFAGAYAVAEDRPAFLHGLLENNPDPWIDPTLRIAGYRALEMGEHELALNLFYRVQRPRLLDVLAMAHAELRLERFDRAEQNLQRALRLGRIGTQPGEFAVLHGLLGELQAARPLRLIPQTTVDALDQLAVQAGLPAETIAVDASTFCDRRR